MKYYCNFCDSEFDKPLKIGGKAIWCPICHRCVYDPIGWRHPANDILRVRDIFECINVIGLRATRRAFPWLEIPKPVHGKLFEMRM